MADVSPGTIRNAEEGSTPVDAVQRRIAAALTIALQRTARAELDEANAIVVRCELELAAAKQMVERARNRFDAESAQLLIDYRELWPIVDDDDNGERAA